MIVQQTRDVERKITAILKILSEYDHPVGSQSISRLLEKQGIYLGERAVRYHLKLMDERGLTRLVGNRDGRIITVSGLDEIRNSLVIDKLGFMSRKIEHLICQTNFNVRSAVGQWPVDVALFNRSDFHQALEIISGVFAAGLCFSGLVASGEEGEALGQTVVPAGMVGLATICSIALNGCLLQAGIPSYPRFGGLLQVRDRHPYRFVDLIEFSGSTIDPSDIFIAGRMTDVRGAASGNEGKIMAAYHEIPVLLIDSAEKLFQRLINQGLIYPARLAHPGNKICEIPSNQDKVGLIAISGLNPIAAAVEAGIEVTSRAMCGMMEVSCLRPFSELLR